MHSWPHAMRTVIPNRVLALNCHLTRVKRNRCLAPSEYRNLATSLGIRHRFFMWIQQSWRMSEMKGKRHQNFGVNPLHKQYEVPNASTAAPWFLNSQKNKDGIRIIPDAVFSISYLYTFQKPHQSLS